MNVEHARVRDRQVALLGDVVVEELERYFRLRPAGMQIDRLYDLGPALHLLEYLEQRGLRVIDEGRP